MAAPLIQLIHAVQAAQAPIHDAFSRLWPEARTDDFTDETLAPDLADAGALTDAFTGRMAGLIGRGIKGGADAVLFTCSAFGGAIEAARAGVPIPVLKPDEAMIDEALSQSEGRNSRIGGLATFAPTIGSLSSELAVAAKARGLEPEITLRHVPGALDALNDGREAEHDRLIAEAAEDLTDVDVLMLAQFSMVRAQGAIADVPGRSVLTAPVEAVRKLRGLLDN